MSNTAITDPPGAQAPSAEAARLKQGQAYTILLLFIGYAGYYLCRSHLSVATPLIIKEFKPQHIDKAYIGGIASLGTLFYAFGKFVSGSLADFLGGKRMFLLGMAGAIAATVTFGLGGIPFFTMAWALNRAIQSTGWVGMVKITSRWFSYSTYGAAMGLISLSYLFGDFFSRVFLGQLIHEGIGWRGVFLIAAAVLGVILVINILFLKESPTDGGLMEPEANPANLFGEDGQNEKPMSMMELLSPLLRSGVFWSVCALSLGFTIMRETFNTWTPQYLTEVVKMDAGTAGTASSLFPLFGGISVVLAGFASDKIGRGGRAAIIFGGILLSVPALLAFGYCDFSGKPALALVALGTVAFMLLGPYSFLAGAISLDFGGKRGSATACGWIDGIGYLGGVYAGKGVGKLAEEHGWSTAFVVLSGIAIVSCAAAALYWWQQTRRAPAVVTEV